MSESPSKQYCRPEAWNLKYTLKNKHVFFSEFYKIFKKIFYWMSHVAGRVENSEISGKFFPSFLSLSFFAIGLNWKFGNENTQNNIYEISKISKVSEFSICYFLIFLNKFYFVCICFFKNHEIYLFFPHEYSIQRPNFKVCTNLRGH